MTMKRGGIPHVQYRCSFCGKSQEKVHRLIAGPGGVYICNECIDLCREIIEEEQAMKEPPAPVAGQDGQEVQLEWSSGRARPTADRDTSGRMGTPNTSTSYTSTSQWQLVDATLRAHLAPLVAELEETRASLERLARENGALRERLQSHEDETE